MAHGGKRKNSGRKAGAVTVKTRKIADKTAASGKTPLEVMVENMRHFHQLACDAEAILEGMTASELLGQSTEGEPPDERAQFEVLLAHVRKAADLRLHSQACAKEAAPYMHPRLATVESKAGAPDEAVPLAERLREYARRDQIAASAGKVVTLKR